MSNKVRTLDQRRGEWVAGGGRVMDIGTRCNFAVRTARRKPAARVSSSRDS